MWDFASVVVHPRWALSSVRSIPCSVPALLSPAALPGAAEGVQVQRVTCSPQRQQTHSWRPGISFSIRFGLLLVHSSANYKGELRKKKKKAFNPKSFWRKNLNAVPWGLMLCPGSWATSDGAVLRAASSQKWRCTLYITATTWQRALPAWSTQFSPHHQTPKNFKKKKRICLYIHI